MKPDKESKLVYSTDPGMNQKCPRCKELLSECVCRKDEKLAALTKGFLRLEKSGRAGKAVTIIDGLPRIEQLLKELSAFLKSRLGTGGKYGYGEKGGFVEIQGDKRDQVRILCRQRNIELKG